MRRAAVLLAVWWRVCGVRATALTQYTPDQADYSSYDTKPFDGGTNAVAREVARLSQGGFLLSIAGGGDTVAALANAGTLDHFSYVSTAGGAFLEWMEGKVLPGVAALEN